MEKCLGCGKTISENSVHTSSYLKEGVEENPDYAGYYCESCLKGKEICNYCGKPVEEIEHWEEGIEYLGDEVGYCKECYEEVKEFLNRKEDYY